MRKLTAEERAAKRAVLQRKTEAIIKSSENKSQRKKTAAIDEPKTEDKKDDVEDAQGSSVIESSDAATVDAEKHESTDN